MNEEKQEYWNDRIMGIMEYWEKDRMIEQ